MKEGGEGTQLFRIVDRSGAPYPHDTRKIAERGTGGAVLYSVLAFRRLFGRERKAEFERSAPDIEFCKGFAAHAEALRLPTRARTAVPIGQQFVFDREIA